MRIRYKKIILFTIIAPLATTIFLSREMISPLPVNFWSKTDSEVELDQNNSPKNNLSTNNFSINNYLSTDLFSFDFMETNQKKIDLEDLQVNARLDEDYFVFKNLFYEREQAPKLAKFQIHITPHEKFYKDLQKNNYKLMSTIRHLNIRRPPVQMEMFLRF